MSDGITIVTGGASGLGAAIVHRLTTRGDQVVVADLDTCDVTREDQVVAMVEKAATLGPINGLVLSAAVETRAPLEETTDEDWQQVLDVNVKGPFLCMKHVVPHMVAAGRGSIVALGSTLGLIAAPQYAAYCASKGALHNLCKQVAIEHAVANVRVNVVAPSATDTGLFMRMTELAPNPDEVRRRVAERMPMRRLATAEEVCAVVLFLLSDESSYISGATVPVDGGLAARRQ